MQTKYARLLHELATKGTGSMKCFGNSMMPILKSGSKLTFQKQDSYNVGDIVFCKVKGRFIDAHKITKANFAKGYLIANNRGRENGWTKTVFGRVVKAEYKRNSKAIQ